ncbi:helix-turn-helix transcriptional regulator [Anaerofustis butyriciformans]|uniref:helix-turn-helix domain-containing protein n=1 Tax=Anaerofustis butyriciformans TaxID=3108533 RepID=UPI002E310AC1|nr:helix-turn-helix transcriptional regulator [Anaerofustis sp. HA2171]
MQLREAINKKIMTLCEESGYSINSLANMAGIPPTTLYSMFDGKCKNPGIKTIKILCDFFEISIRDFFNGELFNDIDKGFE